jgi:hypothetical protein
MRTALARLDPWAFWSVRLEGDLGADYAVVGTTGAFAIAICGLEGYAEPAGDGLHIGGAKVTGFREVKQAARSLRGRLLRASVFTAVEPIICLTRAVAGTSRTVRGVRVVRLEDLPAVIGGRQRTLDQGTARFGAEALGTVLPSSSGALHDEDEDG